MILITKTSLRNYIPKHKTPFHPFRWKSRFDRHNFYWACHFSRRYHRLKNRERYGRRVVVWKEYAKYWKTVIFCTLEELRDYVENAAISYVRLRKEVRR